MPELIYLPHLIGLEKIIVKMRLQLFVLEERGTLAVCNMSKVGLVFPHQLFEEIVFSNDVKEIFVIEHPLFFTQYKFHKAKLILQHVDQE